MKKPTKYKDSSTDDSQNQLNEPFVEYNTVYTQQKKSSFSMPGQYTHEEFMEYLDKAEQRFEEGRGIPHEEALKIINSWE